MLQANKINIYTDGAARGNPARRLWHYSYLQIATKELSNGYGLTTNNRMELMAVIEGLKSLKKNDLPVPYLQR